MSALDDFVTRSATSYLQNAVFVDDNIYSRDNGRPLTETTVQVPAGIKSMFVADLEGEISKSPSVLPVEASEPKEGNELDAYHPRELMESFARKGIVCALYEPRKGFTTGPESELFRLCERADLLVLDWDLHNDGGDAVCDLLGGLIKQSESELPHHVRLVAIYTNKPSLQPVLSMLLEKLERQGCKTEVDEGNLRLVSGATKVSVFGKPVSAGRPPADKAYEVAERDLADRVIAEFAGLHHGILPAFALHGLAALRKNTKRLLDKFSHNLDGAFLLHRALGSGDSEAFDDLPDLLSDEIAAILQDWWPSGIDLDSLAKSKVVSLTLSDPSRPWKTVADGQPFDAKVALRELLNDGESGLRKSAKLCNELKELPKKGFRDIKPARLVDFENMLSSNGHLWTEHLAALYCTRTQYESDCRKLRFGTIVRHRATDTDPWEFSVCIMPICDTVRLASQKRFPFWKLSDDPKCGKSMKRYGIGVEIDGSTRTFAAGGKIRDSLWIAPFSPNETTKCVEALEHESGFLFATAGLIIEWVAELKPLHAQRVAAHLGAEVSRVGLVESEWLRLLCDR
jgi:hypothetical protein